MNQSDNTNTFTQRELAWAPVVLSLVTIMAYYKSLFYGFIFDDLPTITHYFHIKFFDPVGQFFANPRWISRIINQMIFKYWNNSPFVHRIVNLSIHLATGLLIFYIFKKLFKRSQQDFIATHHNLLATLTTLFFLLYPVQTQTVTYITQMRLEGLVALFTFATIGAFVAAVTTSSPSIKQRSLIASYILCAFAAGTKEIIIVLPALILLVDYFFIAQGDLKSLRQRMLIHAGYALALYGTLGYMGVIRPTYISHLATTSLSNNRGNLLTPVHQVKITPTTYAYSQFKVMLHYITIFFRPQALCFDYDIVLSSSPFATDVILPFLVLLLMAGGMFFMWKKERCNLIVFSYLWFLISMLPRTSIFPSTELVCDYKTYLASFGMMLFFAFLTTQTIHYVLTHYQQHRLITRGVLIGLCGTLAWATVDRNFIWSSELSFWKDAAEKAGKPRDFNNYGTALWTSGNREHAIKSFEQAIERDPVYGEPHVNLATIYQSEGNVDKALEHYRRAIDSGEGHRELFHNLGILHLTHNNYKTAIICFEEAARLSPYYSRAYLGLGKAYQLLNQNDEAFAAYEKALAGDHQDEELYYFYGSLAYEKGLHQQARQSLEQVRPQFMDTAFKLGCCYYAEHQYGKAAEAFQLAINKEPNNISYAYNGAQAYLHSNQFELARTLLERCLPEQHNLPYVPLHLSRCLYELGNKEEAYRLASEIVQTTSNEFVRRDGIILLEEFKQA